MPNIKKQTKLWFSSIAKADIGAMEKLLDGSFDIDTVDANGNSALILASFYDKLDVIDFLISNKCNLDLQCEPSVGFWRGGAMSALATAAGLGHINVMVRLIKAKANMADKLSKTEIGIGSLYKSPLYHAVYGGHIEAAALLIEAGAKVDMKKIIGCTKIAGSAYTSFEIEEIINKLVTKIQITDSKKKLEKMIKKSGVKIMADNSSFRL